MDRSLAEVLAEGKGLEDLEKEIWEEACEWAKAKVKQTIEDLDIALSKRRDKGLRLIGNRPRKLITKFGDIRFERRLYREKGSGCYRFLLDEVLKLPVKEAVSETVAKLAFALASVLPYARATELLAEFLPQSFSATALQRMVWRFGERVEAEEARRQEAVFENGEVPAMGEGPTSRLMVEADGVSVALQREEQRRGEVKVGIGYTGWKRVAYQRYQVEGKVVHIGIEEPETFWERFWLGACKRYDLSNLKYVVLNGDGAKWIPEGLMGIPGVMQLDRFHLWRALRLGLGGEDHLASQVYQEATGGGWDKAKALLESFLDRPDLSAERLRAAADVCDYMASNRAGLQDWRSRVESQPGDRSLGAMEGNVDKLIATRTKRRGMSWRKKGVHAMAKLLQSVHEDEVATYASPYRRKPADQSVTARRTKVLTRKILCQESPFQASLPGVTGPHANRPWAKLLKAIATPSLN